MYVLINSKPVHGHKISEFANDIWFWSATVFCSPSLQYIGGKIKNFKLDQGSKNKKVGKQGKAKKL